MPGGGHKNQGVGGRSRPERPPPFRVRTISICDLQAQHLSLRSAIVSGVCEVVPKLQIRNPKRVQGQVAAGVLWVSWAHAMLPLRDHGAAERCRESEGVPQILSLCCPPRLGAQGVERDCHTDTIAIPFASCTGTARRAPTIACWRVFRDDLHPRAGMPPRRGC